MEIPFTIKMENLKNKIIENINEAKMPAFNVNYILSEIQKLVTEMDNEEIEKYYKELEFKQEEDK